ncbi:hypothetical protein PTKIN_Ptkin08bG0180400 [Pterospermum kingtungense]
MGGIGVIVRNSMGKVMGTLTASVNWVTDPTMVEAVAVVKALQFALNMGFYKIVLEGDSIGVLKRLSLRKQDLSAVGVVVVEGKVLLSHLD